MSVISLYNHTRYRLSAFLTFLLLFAAATVAEAHIFIKPRSGEEKHSRVFCSDSDNSSLACLLRQENGAIKRKVYLVSVGVSNYPGKSNDLMYADDDARKIVATYKAASVNVVAAQILDEKATKRNILSVTRQLFSQATEDDIVVFYFSGHGYNSGLMVYDGALSYALLRKTLSKSKCHNKMIFADACFSGTFRTQGKTDHEQPDNKSNVMLFLSSRGNETSSENGLIRQGLFTAFLTEGLRNGADENGDNIITARELYDYVNPRVVKESRKQQHPVMWGKFPDNLPVVIYSTSTDE